MEGYLLLDNSFDNNSQGVSYLTENYITEESLQWCLNWSIKSGTHTQIKTQISLSHGVPV